jgi:hypothetical protein
LVGGAGADQLAGEAGDDFLYGGDDHDTLVGGDGADQLDGGSGDDVLAGGLMNDRLFGRTGNDQLNGNEGNDKLYGQSGADLLHGDDGDDRLFGQIGADILHGDAGNDYLVGGADNDILLGGLGDDRLVGEAGADTFKMDGLGHDTILDFQAGEDTIDLSSLLVRLMPLAPPTANVEIAAREAVADEFQVNSFTDANQVGSSTTALNDGGFVVTWSSWGQDDGLDGTYGQRFDSAGVAVGSEFQVHSYATLGHSDSSATTLNNGDFVVTWTSWNGNIWSQDGSSYGIYGQRFDSAGATVGGAFQVNTFTDNHQSDSSTAALNDGGFVVTWTSEGQDGSNYGIYGQRYDSAGAAVGAEFQVNTFTANWQAESSTAALNDGGFVVTWTSVYQDGSGPGIYGQRFDSAGATVGAEFKVNSFTWNSQFDSSTTALNDGGFVVTWTSEDGGYDIYGQHYDSAGVAVGGEFKVNTFSTNSQTTPSATALNDGGFVVAWSSEGQDGSGIGVYGQRFDSEGQAVMAEPAVIGVQSLDFNDLNLIAGDSMTLNIEGGNSLEAVLGSAGLDQALENLASSLATYSDLFSAVSAEQGVLTFQGLTDGSAVAEVSVAITPATDLGLETLVIDSNENNDAVIDFQATGGSVTLEGVEMANLSAAHFQLHDTISVV